MPRITAKIDLGHLLTIAAMVITAVIAFARIDSKLDYVAEKVAKLESLNDRVVRVEMQVARPH